MTIQRRVGVWAVLLVALGLGCRDERLVAPDHVSQVRPNPAAVSDAGARHVVVLDEQREPSSDFLSVVAALGGRVERRHDAIGVVTVIGLGDVAASGLATRSDVAAVERDRVVQWLPTSEGSSAGGFLDVVTESDQSGAFWFAIGYQWNIHQIAADLAWLVSPQGDGALVCILDTGVDPTHEDLTGKVDLTKSVSFVPSEPSIDDYHFHGTAVAALVASTGYKLASVAPEARLCAVKVLDGSGHGSFDDVVSGIMHAADVGADVINMSLGALLPRKTPETRATVLALQRAVLSAVRRRVLVVAGVGNHGLDLDGSGSIVVPAQLAGVLGVGATAPLDQADFDRLASYTNYGRSAVDLTAPGGDTARVASNPRNLRDALVSACSRSSLLFTDCALGSFHLVGLFGTSFATPHVSAAAAVLESAIPGDQEGSQLTACLNRGADHPDGQSVSRRYGRGRVNVLRALQSAGCGS